MQDAKKFRIKDFPTGEGFWRIDWLSNIHKNPVVPSEQLITVFFTKLKSPDKPGSIYPLSPRSLDTEQRKIAEIGVGLLPLVRIGSVWQNGYRIDKGMAYTTRTFTVDSALAKPIKFSAHAQPPLQGRLIPAIEYPLGLKSWEKIQSAPLMALPVGDDPFGLLIPAIEIIRFYYIYSTFSARALFYGQYEVLYSEYSCTQDTPLPHVTLKLSWNAIHHDAWVLARYVASETMQRRVKKIHEWVQHATLGKAEQGFFESIFPFEDATTLKVEGIDIKGDDGKTRFLGVRLRNCTHEMPYSGVSIDIETKSAESEKPEIQRPIWLKTWPKGLDQESLQYEHSQESDKNIARMILDESDERFSALKGMKLNKNYQKSESASRDKKYRKSDTQKTGIGTSEGTYGERDLIPGEITQNVVPEEDSAPPTLESFLVALNELRQKGLQVTTIEVGKGGLLFRGEIISFFQKNGTSNRQWSVIRGDEIKLRGFIVAKVSNPKGCAYVIEMERKPDSAEKFSTLIIALSEFTDIPDSELDSFARKCEIYGRWPPESEIRNVKREITNHRDLPDPKLGARILVALERIGLM